MLNIRIVLDRFHFGIFFHFVLCKCWGMFRKTNGRQSFFVCFTNDLPISLAQIANNASTLVRPLVVFFLARCASVSSASLMATGYYVCDRNGFMIGVSCLFFKVAFTISKFLLFLPRIAVRCEAISLIIHASSNMNIIPLNESTLKRSKYTGMRFKLRFAHDH